MNYFNLIGGLGLFLFGMNFLESSIREMVGSKMKKVLRQSTSNIFKAILSGITVTAILQSSSLVGLITLSFVGAGILTLEMAFGIILGANLGTTLTGWIFNFLGFQYSMSNVAWLSIGLGGVSMTLLQDGNQLKKLSKFLMAFGLLFVGLALMKESMAVMASHFHFTDIHSSNRFIYFIAGFIVTGIIQSSSASMVLTLSALHSGMIQFESAVAFVLGADLGTTITLFFGMIGGTTLKKRVAISHFLFNFFNNVLGLILLGPLIYFVTKVLNISNELTALVACHSTLNIFGIIFFFPFLRPFVALLKRIVKEKADYFETLDMKAQKSQVVAEYLLLRVKDLHTQVYNNCLKVLQYRNPRHAKMFLKSYEIYKKRIGEFTKYTLGSMAGREDSQNLAALNLYLDVFRNLMNALKGLKDITHDLEFIFEKEEEQIPFYLNMKNSFLIDGEGEGILKNNESTIYSALMSGEIDEIEASTLINVFTELEWLQKSFKSAKQSISKVENTFFNNSETGLSEKSIIN